MAGRAPQQLAEATAAATDLVCSGCVGTTDIANNAVTSGKIGSGQVGNGDIATDAVTTTKIKGGEVKNSDLATSAVTSSKISDTAGVQSVDIVNGQVTSADIGDVTITSADIANDVIKPNGHFVLEMDASSSGRRLLLMLLIVHLEKFRPWRVCLLWYQCKYI